MDKKMQDKILMIEGMTCINCQNKIERKLKNTKGISFARVSFPKAQAEISYDESIISMEQISAIVSTLGYEVVNTSKKSFARKLKTPGIILVIIILYIILQHFGILNLLVPSAIAESKMSYGALFIVGLLTSVHCITMCGGINLSQSLPSENQNSAKSKVLLAPLLYNAGRLLSYTIMGFILGGIGMLISGGTSTGLPIVVQGILKIFAGILMVIMGANMLGLSRWLRRIRFTLPKKAVSEIARVSLNQKHPFIIGLLNVLMPCGPMQSMQVVALASGNPFAGALSMFMFSLGTIPLMLGLGSLVAAFGKKFTKTVMNIGSILVVVLGLAMFTQGTNLAGINLNIFSKTATKQTQQASKQNAALTEKKLNYGVISDDGKVQYVESNLTYGNYPEITVYSGVPVKWTINVPEQVLTGCNYRMIMPTYKIGHEFKPGKNTIEFTPGEPGTDIYTCWMGMIYGKINIIKR